MVLCDILDNLGRGIIISSLFSCYDVDITLDLDHTLQGGEDA